MIKFDLERTDTVPERYDVTFYKLVHKRSGDYVEEPSEKFYEVPLKDIKREIILRELSTKLEDVSLKEFLIEYNKCYDEVCELLKKIL